MDKPQARREGELVGGKYRLVRYLAAGGMGAVYEAQHTVVRRRFAIKLLRAELAAQRESLTRFEREAEVAGTLENENVAATIDFGIAEDGSPYIVMEYLAGESLRSLIDRVGRIPISRACEIVVQASRGVEAAHKAGIIHRDINPQNLFLCRRDDGTDLVKVLDFGIAKLAAAESAETQTGAILGTPAYLSPEQARGEKTVDHRTDIYGLGAVFYELLTGHKPHPAGADHRRERVERACRAGRRHHTGLELLARRALCLGESVRAGAGPLRQARGLASGGHRRSDRGPHRFDVGNAIAAAGDQASPMAESSHGRGGGGPAGPGAGWFRGRLPLKSATVAPGGRAALRSRQPIFRPAP
jgi:tRNA A-37 threonylcarbamoyl transferase component Bud32